MLYLGHQWEGRQLMEGDLVAWVCGPQSKRILGCGKHSTGVPWLPGLSCLHFSRGLPQLKLLVFSLPMHFLFCGQQGETMEASESFSEPSSSTSLPLPQDAAPHHKGRNILLSKLGLPRSLHCKVHTNYPQQAGCF